VTPTAAPPPIYYHDRHIFSELGPAAVRYDQADRRPESTVGIHFFADAAAAGAAGDLAALEYDMRPEAVRPVRDALIQEHEEWVGAAGKPAHTLEEATTVAH
jgi:hypothetical protein